MPDDAVLMHEDNINVEMALAFRSISVRPMYFKFGRTNDVDGGFRVQNTLASVHISAMD